MAGTAPNASRKASLPKATRGTNCAITCWTRPLPSSSIGPALSGFAFTLSATKSFLWHEDSARRFLSRASPKLETLPEISARVQRRGPTRGPDETVRPTCCGTVRAALAASRRGWSPSEHGQINSLCHCLIPGVIRMQTIRVVKAWAEFHRVLRILSR